MFNVFTLNTWWTIALMIPTYIDGLTQALFNRESTNFLRVTTGIFTGIGGMSLVAIVGKSIGGKLLPILK